METSAGDAGWSPASSIPPWDQVSFAPPAAFVVPPEFSRDVPTKEGSHLTQLCWQRQVDVEAEASFHCTAVRLETALAVQHQSQWQLNLDPRYRHLVVHWLRVVRDGRVIDQLQRDRMRLIQRETQLEHLVIDGQWTLLRVLDDVRVGDTIEAAYSYIGPNPVRPNGCDTFFLVPPSMVVGFFDLRVTFARDRANMGRLRSDDAPAPSEIELPDGRLCWRWSGSQPEPRQPEPNQPSTFLDFIWIQVSDLPDWGPLCANLGETWERTVTDASFAEQPPFARPAEVNEQAVAALIQYLQDEFRYLSVDLESGGWIPQRPEVVATRRYGDCKDLVWLATQILRRWGVAARPILVGSGLRERVKTLRPMALLFNHAVLEVEIAGARRWFDLTLRLQGGDFHHRWIGAFGFGLPVDARAHALVEQPGQPELCVYSVRETVLLDTRRGEPSFVEIRVRTEGPHAENFRRKRLSEGPDEFARERLRFLQARYPKAVRLGALHCRDDRERNTFEIAEAFQVSDIIYSDESGNRALFDVPGNLAIQTLNVPEDRPRRAPWDLPFPIELRHKIVLHAGGMGAGKRRARRWVTPEFVGTLDEPRFDGVWTKTIRVVVKVTEVPTARVAAYRQELDRFLQSTTWRLYLPWGHRSAALPATFGQLPPPEEGAPAYVSAADPATFEDASLHSADEDARIIRPGSVLSRTLRGGNVASWRIAAPILAFAAMMLARSCSTLTVDTPRNFDSFAPRVPLPSRSASSLNFDGGDSDSSDDDVLPLSPELHGEVYHSANEVDRVPDITYRSAPTYPRRLRSIGLEGEALVDFVVNDQGIPTQITVAQQTHPAFGKSARVGVAKWRFRPATKDGHPVNMALRVPIVFKLEVNRSLETIFDDNRLESVDSSSVLSFPRH